LIRKTGTDTPLLAIMEELGLEEVFYLVGHGVVRIV
jgi:hypothetical protein